MAFTKVTYISFLCRAVGNNPQYLLCYRATTHDWAANTFHSRCGGKNHPVTLVKNGEYVFGGYSDLPWSKCDSSTVVKANPFNTQLPRSHTTFLLIPRTFLYSDSFPQVIFVEPSAASCLDCQWSRHAF